MELKSENDTFNDGFIGECKKTHKTLSSTLTSKLRILEPDSFVSVYNLMSIL